MNRGLITGILGRFLQIYAVLVALPALLIFIYPEPVSNFYIFTGTAVFTFTAGTVMTRIGHTGEPSVKEAMLLTVLGWIVAVIIGAVPLTQYMPVIDAVFEASSGLTTTGISLVRSHEALPHSILFWRGFMQWIGGLGILTFFIAVIKKSGGISQRLFSAEAHKTDPGSIRPSVTKSITDLWRVYGFLTTILIGLLVAFEMPVFDALVHAFSTLSTGGFSSQSTSFAAYSPEIKVVTTLFMLFGGINFVIFYRVLRADYRPLKKNTEFKAYVSVFLILSILLVHGFLGKTSLPVIDGFFQGASFISSTGFSTVDSMILSPVFQIMLIAVMFMGGSLGSTSGGLKTFRVITLFKLLKTRLDAYTLPKSAVNSVKIDSAILDSSAVKTISVLFFTWIVTCFMLGIFLVGIEGYSFKGGLSVAVSSLGNMGPVFIDQVLVEASVPSKIFIVVAMIAGRLEMLPLLAVFNRTAIKD